MAAAAAAQDKLVAKLNAFKKTGGNSCANCTSKAPGYACTDFYTFVCTTCSGLHREMQHKIKGISMSKWSDDEVNAMLEGGNIKDEAIYLGRWNPKISPKPDSANQEAVRKFISDKYVEKRWYVCPSVALAQLKQQSANEQEVGESAPAADAPAAPVAAAPVRAAAAPAPVPVAAPASAPAPVVDKSRKQDGFICPILNELFEDAVKAEDGITYERRGIEAWFTSCQQRNRPITSPWTREQMGTNVIADVAATAGAKKLRHELWNASCIENADVLSVHSLRQVFSALDPLRDILQKSLDGWQPPQVVVLGQESSGKSTLLERLAMMPIFPRNDNICTRLPIHVRLRTTQDCKPTTLEVFNVSNNSTEDGPYVIPAEHGAADVRERMESIILKEHGALNGGVSLERIIILTISSPHVPSIDLIDLPGLVQSPDSMRESTLKIAEDHIRKHGQYSLFLVTVSATEAPNQSAAMQLVRSKKLQDRTIGVFTMCDEVVQIERRKNLLMQRLEAVPSQYCGAEVLDPHGWVCVMNKEIKAAGLSNFVRLKQQALAEKDFMREHMPDALRQDKAGCDALWPRLEHQFLGFMGRTWGPRTVKLLDQALDEAVLDNAALGLPACHVAGTQHAAKAREMAASEAKRRMESGKKELVQGCCSKVLQQLKSKLTSITSENLVKVDASEFTDKWEAQRERFEDACRQAVDEWADYWVQGVKQILQKRQSVAVTTAQKAKMVQNPAFELDRFPSFITVVEANVHDLLRAARARMFEGVSAVADKYYGIMSPWVTVETELGDVANVSVTCNNRAVVENAMLCFIKEGTATIFNTLSSQFVQMCGEVPDSGWIESCAEERMKLSMQIKTLQDAKRDVVAMLDKVMGDQLPLPCLAGKGVVEGDCKYITGCANTRGIAVDESGHVLVALENVPSIKVFSGAGPSGTFVREFGKAENFNCPKGVAVDHEGSVYVCNYKAHSVTVLNNKDANMRYIGLGHLRTPEGVAVDSQKNVYVCNSTANTVSVLNAAGTLVRNIVGLSTPAGVAVDEKGEVYVTCYGAHTVHVYDRIGSFIRQLGSGVAGTAPGQLYSPWGVAVDSEGCVYVANYEGNNVSVFDKHGNFTKQIPCNKPGYIAVDAHNQLLISEVNASRIYVMRR